MFIAEWYSENMGYAENLLPKAMAALGHEVHLVTSTAQVYYTSRTYEKTYQPFLGPRVMPTGKKVVDGYTVHRLPLIPNRVGGTPGIDGLMDYLSVLRPQIIQTFEIANSTTHIAARYCYLNDCRLFLESHTHASVFDSADRLFSRRWLMKLINHAKCRVYRSRLEFINGVAERCYPIATDVARIVVSYFHVSADKVKIQSLGVDTDLFHPPSAGFLEKERDALRAMIGLDKSSLVCIYTGRFSRDKNPQCLARAVHRLQSEAENIQALFVGNGTESEIKEIREMKGCFIHKFVPVKELRNLYWISDIGVWPTQESTSQLDAAACGLPLVLSNRIEVRERVDGNGFLYKEDDELDLALKIKLFKDHQVRQRLSDVGMSKVQSKFSWASIARERVDDYLMACTH